MRAGNFNFRPTGNNVAIFFCATLLFKSVLEGVHLRSIATAAAAPTAAPHAASASELRLRMGTATLDATCGKLGRRSLATVPAGLEGAKVALLRGPQGGPWAAD